jgi:hypothetical protein
MAKIEIKKSKPEPARKAKLKKLSISSLRKKMGGVQVRETCAATEDTNMMGCPG